MIQLDPSTIPLVYLGMTDDYKTDCMNELEMLTHKGATNPDYSLDFLLSSEWTVHALLTHKPTKYFKKIRWNEETNGTSTHRFDYSERDMYHVRQAMKGKVYD